MSDYTKESTESKEVAQQLLSYLFRNKADDEYIYHGSKHKHMSVLRNARCGLYTSTMTFGPDFNVPDENGHVHTRRMAHGGHVHFFVLDDIGTKHPVPALPPTAVIESSEGNFQYLYALTEPATLDEAKRLTAAIKRLDPPVGDPGALKPNQLARLPLGINGKNGNTFRVRLVSFEPRSWSMDRVVEELGLTLGDEVVSTVPAVDIPDDDPTLTILGQLGLLRQRKPHGYEMGCPRADLHTSGTDTGCFYNGVTINCPHDGCRDMDLMTEARNQFLEQVGGMPDQPAKLCPTTFQEAKQMLGASNLPDVQLTQNGVAQVQMATKDNIQYLLDTVCAELRYNEMTREEELALPWHSHDLNSAYDDVTSLALTLGIRASQQVAARLDTLARDNGYHPFTAWLEGGRWDGVSRFDALADSVTLAHARERELWRIYLRRWLIQVYRAGTLPEPGQLRGVLLLAGEQGIGKTRWLGSLLPSEMFVEGVAIGGGASAERDALQTATSGLVAELGEIDATFRKADVSHLKNLITRQMDNYRAAYARKHTRAARRTVFCGSVNVNEVLQDNTGNSRYWPIEMDALDPGHGIDMRQLWLEVGTWDEQWWLTDVESRLQKDNEHHYRSYSHVEIATKDYFQQWGHLVHDESKCRPMNSMTFCRDVLGIEKPNKRDMNDAAAMLRVVTGTPSKTLTWNKKAYWKAWWVPVNLSGNIVLVDSDTKDGYTGGDGDKDGNPEKDK